LSKKGSEQSSIAIHNYHMLITGKRRRDYGG
jgi:hypothetical protein